MLENVKKYNFPPIILVEWIIPETISLLSRMMVPRNKDCARVPGEQPIGLPAVAVATGSFLTGMFIAENPVSLPYPALMCGLSIGAMASLSMIAIPVFLDTNNNSAAATQLVRQWVRTYHYGHIILPGICIGACGLYGYAAFNARAVTVKSKPRSGYWYAMAAFATIAMVPFTWVIMTPTNNALFGMEFLQGANLSVVRALVVRWAWLHAARSLFPLLGVILGFRGLFEELRS